VYEVLDRLRIKVVSWERGPSDCAGAPAPQSWRTTTPKSVGLDGAALDALTARVAKGEIAGIHSFLVVRDAKLAYERYFSGPDFLWAQPLGPVAFGPETLHDCRSVSKSVVGVLVGIAHGEGAIPDLDAPLASFFPEHAKGREADLAGRSLRHALTMSAGLSWDELTHPYWDPRNDEHGLWRADDPLEYALSRKPIAPGGARFAYNGGMPTVLAAAIEKATKLPLDVFARERLWCPLGVTQTEWLQHRSGLFVAASGLRLLPRDIARFGQMMLDDGRFAGRQIVPADYARASLSAQVSTGPGFFVPSYGYQWWIGELPAASGNGGQRVLVDKQRRMVTVITAGLYDSREQGEAPMRLFEGVLGALH
jgi:CubicO group peptidase (beta-lactamase class C family)